MGISCVSENSAPPQEKANARTKIFISSYSILAAQAASRSCGCLFSSSKTEQGRCPLFDALDALVYLHNARPIQCAFTCSPSPTDRVYTCASHVWPYVVLQLYIEKKNVPCICRLSLWIVAKSRRCPQFSFWSFFFRNWTFLTGGKPNTFSLVARSIFPLSGSCLGLIVRLFWGEGA